MFRFLSKLVLGLGLAGLLAGCAADPVWAPDDVVKKATYRHNGPPKITLLTMVNVRSGAGAHTSMMINGSQRVIFDPSGSFKHPLIPERNDVLFGVTPRVAQVYTGYHARETFYVKVQEKIVSPQVAEQALQLALNNGAVMNAYCAHSTSTILSKLPGFESIKPQMYPNKVAEQFAQLPGVSERTLREYDSDDNSKVLRDFVPGKAQPAASD